MPKNSINYVILPNNHDVSNDDNLHEIDRIIDIMDLDDTDNDRNTVLFNQRLGNRMLK